MAEIIKHPTYVSRQVADDIALILLESPVEWGPSVQPVCLPEAGVVESFSGRMGTVAGWGWTDEVKNGTHNFSYVMPLD